MADVLFALGQVLCIFGLLYGAYLSITYRQPDPKRKRSPEEISFDPVTTHTWSLPAETLEDRLRRVS